VLKIGCHLSISNGFLAIAKEAASIGANTFQFFSRSPRGGRAKPLDNSDVQAYLAFAREHGIGPILAHAPYTLNCAAEKEPIQAFARQAMEEDILRLEAMPGSFYNFHPGSHVGQGLDRGVALICAVLDEAMGEAKETTVLLETMAGKGTEIGGAFEELKRILDGSKHSDRMGVCLDTCHASDAGYDVKGDLDGVLESFDKEVGLGRLKAVHLNDSKNAQGSKKDRHEKIGEGFLGLEAAKGAINHPALQGLPFILETPNDLEGYQKEIALLKALYEGGV
jgi:deoxyribonuclease-4